MPQCQVSGNCPHCQKTISQNVWYNYPEEIAGERDAKFHKYIARGFFIFGMTVMLFVWGLVIMFKEYDMRKLTTLLSHPKVQMEETYYSDVRKDVNADVTKIIKTPQEAEKEAPKKEK